MPKTDKLILDDYGAYLGMSKGKFLAKDKKGKVREYPMFESDLGEVVLKSGNTVSVGALNCLAFWEIDTMLLTRKGKPSGYLRSLEYDSHVKTRLRQYEMYLSDKCLDIAKEFVLGKLKSQNVLLKKYDLEPIGLFDDKVLNARSRKILLALEAKSSKEYFKRIFTLIPNMEKRKTFNAYDGINNVFNLCYTVLKWKCHIATIRAKLEPYLGFLHTVQVGKPSLVLDFMELYRCFIDDFVIGYSKKLNKNSFVVKLTFKSRRMRGKREFLSDEKTNVLMKDLFNYFENVVLLPRVVGRKTKNQTLETLISEEALLFAKYLRKEILSWKPRTVFS